MGNCGMKTLFTDDLVPYQVLLKKTFFEVVQLHFTTETIFYHNNILSGDNVIDTPPPLFFVRREAPENFLKDFLNKKKFTDTPLVFPEISWKGGICGVIP